MVTKVLIVLLSLFSGVIAGILLTPVLHTEGIRIIFGISFFLAAAVFYSIVRSLILRQGKTLKTPENLKEGSEVGFVVETFHELVGKLKEKEKELARLKALAEEKAAGMEVYNENILQSVPSGVVTVNNSMKIQSINNAARRILGIAGEDIIGRNFTEVFNENLSSLISKNETMLRGEYSYVTGDNRHIWIGATSSKLKNTAGETIGTIFVFVDLTDIKALRTQVELKERLSQLGEMSAGISHEFRNSMSVISGYANLLSKKFVPSNNTAVDAILLEVKNMDVIISELLAFAKPTVLNTASVDLNDLVKKTVSTVIGDNKNIRVRINAGGNVYIKADEVLLKQALVNLFINAVESMPEGGNLDITTGSVSDKVTITIKDTGHGISDNIKAKIFLPFYTTKEKGIGLGLALVQKIIVSHGGIIDVESREGAVFRITLPAA
ncbi:MAG: PAS domain-containing protein [Nitrospirae bacterium]|nr:PAS domain-containing protein [Nitrospirota bacterium]